MVVSDGPGAKTALPVPSAASHLLTVVGLEALRSELRQGDGTQSRDKMLMDDVFITLRRPGGRVGPGVVFQPLLEELGYPQPGRFEVGACVHLVLELHQFPLGVPLGASEGGPLLAA